MPTHDVINPASAAAVELSRSQAAARARRLVLLSNPSAGSGKGRRVADRFASALAGGGHTVARVDVREGDDRVREAVASGDLLVVFGGDGTVYHALPAIIAKRIPFYHVPMGTENLLGREFGMSRRLDALLDAIGRWDVRSVDAGESNGAPFAAMCSVGPDAGIVRRMTAMRRGTVSRWSYAGPILKEIARPHLPKVEITIDGTVVEGGRRGQVIVANSRHYAGRLNPAHNARVGDGMLDLVFLPATTSASMVRWAGACWRRRVASWGGVVARGREIAVREVDGGPLMCQADGDAFDHARDEDHDASRLAVSVVAGALRVLCPATRDG